MARCESCGSKVPPESDSCPECGKSEPITNTLIKRLRTMSKPEIPDSTPVEPRIPIEEDLRGCWLLPFLIMLGAFLALQVAFSMMS